MGSSTSRMAGITVRWFMTGMLALGARCASRRAGAESRPGRCRSIPSGTGAGRGRNPQSDRCPPGSPGAHCRDRRRFLAGGAAAAGVLTLAPGAAGAEVAPAPADLPAPLRALVPRGAPAPISEAERTERRAAAQRLMVERGVAGMLVEPGPTLDYFAGIAWGRSERLFGLLLPQRGEGIVIAPAFEAGRAQLEVRDRFAIRVWQEDESPFALVLESLAAAGAPRGRVAVDPSARVFVFTGLAGAAGAAYEIVSGAAVVEGTRGIKSGHEIEIMRFANEVTLQAYAAAFRTLEPGQTQAELGRVISAAMTQLGFSGGALVLFGESSAYPHGAPNAKPLAAGDIVLVDGGLSVHGYRSDITRTISLGAAPAEAERVFEVVRGAQAAALAAARPGAPAGAVDAAARGFVARAGYGSGYERFTHRVGHGIGLEGHEWPYLVRGSTVELQPGMSFSDEPGIYQMGKFGVRCEDIMVITHAGAQLLTPPASRLRFDP
ncbi:MAG: aminopeptidase P family protein [Gemmatimonadetes bacterium]|nr:aminopeptidase P family protein [Gemmatimonadota bacterium]